MRGAQRWIVGMALSGALVALGCGDDSVAPADGPMPDGPIADRPADGHPDGMGMADAGPSVTVAAVELHGTVTMAGNQVPLMKAAVNISTTPADFMYDVGGAGVPGCSAFSYDLTASTPKLPPALYDIGNVVVTMYTGQPISTAHATTTCTYSAAGYECDFPDLYTAGAGNYPEITATGGAQHWIAPGDRLNFAWPGASGIGSFNMRLPAASAAVDNFTTGSVTAKQGSVNVTGCTGTNTVELQGNTNAFAFDQDLLVKFDCGSTGGTPNPCGLVAVSMSASQTDPRKGANATCTALITSANNCVKIPAAELGVLHYTGWDAAPGAQIQTSVVHFGTGFSQSQLSGASGLTFGAARGNFFIRVP